MKSPVLPTRLSVASALRALERALPASLLGRFVVVGPAATRLALAPLDLVELATAPRLTLAFTPSNWTDCAISTAECLLADGWRMDRQALPDGAGIYADAWPVVFSDPDGWRIELAVADGISGAGRPGHVCRLRQHDVVVPCYPAGDIAVASPQLGGARVQFAAPGNQVLADLLACASPLARQSVDMRQDRAAHAIAVASLMAPEALQVAFTRWTHALDAAGYPAQEALQLACSSLIDTLQHANALHARAVALLGRLAPSAQAFERAQARLLERWAAGDGLG